MKRSLAMVCAVFVVALAVVAPRLAAAAPVKTAHTQAELLAEAPSVRPGQPFTIGLSLTPDPGWHTYWINPGDAGKPAQLKWDAPEGLEFGDLEFPAPGFVPFMGMMSYGYNEPTLLLVDVIQTQPAAGDTLLIRARASWLVCDDKLCIPERANLALEIPVAGDEPPAPAAEDWRVAAFAEARALLPQPVEWKAAFHESGGEVLFELATPLSLENAATLYLFPEAEGMIDHTAAQQVDVWPDRIRVAVPAGRRVARYEDTGLVLAMAMDGAPRQAFSLAAQRSEGATEGDGGALASLVVPPGGNASAGGGGHAQGGGGSSAAADSGSGFLGVAFWQAVVFAILGGLILNLMPCVLPILSLKALGVAQMAGEDPAEARSAGLQFMGGVLASLAAFAALIIILRQGGEAVGWAFHMQNPLIVAILALVMVAVGLNLLGVFEIRLSTGALGGKATQGKAGEFFTGILAVLVATPCTAPFMAPALGYALLQPAAVTVGVFVALGLGLWAAVSGRRFSSGSSAAAAASRRLDGEFPPGAGVPDAGHGDLAVLGARQSGRNQCAHGGVGRRPRPGLGHLRLAAQFRPELFAALARRESGGPGAGVCEPVGAAEGSGGRRGCGGGGQQQ